jgi:hypothetical protein
MAAARENETTVGGTGAAADEVGSTSGLSADPVAEPADIQAILRAKASAKGGGGGKKGGGGGAASLAATEAAARKAKAEATKKKQAKKNYNQMP